MTGEDAIFVGQVQEFHETLSVSHTNHDDGDGAIAANDVESILRVHLSGKRPV